MPSVSLTRRRFLAGAAAAAAPAALAPRPARAQSAVKIGTAVLGDYSMAGPIIVALEKGFFGEVGAATEGDELGDGGRDPRRRDGLDRHPRVP